MELAQYLYAQIGTGALDEAEGLAYLREALPSDIAIVGMSCEYTGAPDLFAFERLIRAGRNGFVQFPQRRRGFFPMDHRYLVDAEQHTGIPGGELFVRMSDQLGAYLDDVDGFDHEFFDIPEDEATYIDPMHRLALKHLYLALEHSGATKETVRGTRTAIYVGKDRSISGSYASEIENDSELVNPGTWEGILASRLNYLYDLSGGSLVVDTACSSSLVAAHIATKMLRDSEIDMALVGGIALGLAPRQGEIFGDYASVETVRDHLKVFDTASSGTIFGEGVGVVVLKRVEDALRAGDHIYSVLRASGINSDGHSNGLTAPNPKAQTRLIAETYERAAISPSTVGYVDAHGTGTKLGDPIEIRGLTDAFRAGGMEDFGTCALSSLKENIGHTVGAAGVGGMIKMSLALDSRTIYPSAGFEVPNDYIKFVDTPFYVPDELQHWEKVGDQPRRGAVSSFGFSGTNGHVVLEEFDPELGPDTSGRELPFVVSAPSADQLVAVLDGLLTYVADDVRRRLVDVSYTLVARRTRYDHAVSFTASSFPELEARLTEASRAVGAGTASPHVAVRLGGMPDTASAAAEILLAQVRMSPESLPLIDRARLTIHGTGDFLESFDFADAQVCGLPGHRFAGKPLWGTVKTYNVYETPDRIAGVPMNGRLLASKVLSSPDTDTYSMELDPELWYLHDHRIAGSPTLSGTAYAQLAAEIAEEQFGQSGYELRRMMFKNLLQVPQAHTALVQVQRRSVTELAVEVFTPDTSGTPLAHASFTLQRLDETTIDVGEAVADELFEGMARISVRADSGAFQFLGRWDTSLNEMTEIWAEPGELLMRLRLADEFAADVEDFHVSPAMLDLLAGGVSWERGSSVDRQFLPLSYGRVVYTGARLTATSYSRTRLRYDRDSDPLVATADVRVYNACGELVVMVERYAMRAFTPSGDELTYHEVVYREIRPAIAPVTSAAGSFWVVADTDTAAGLRATVPAAVAPSVRYLSPGSLPEGERATTIVYVVRGANLAETAGTEALDTYFEFAKNVARYLEPGGRLVVLAAGGAGGSTTDAFDRAALAAARVIGMENPRTGVVAVSDPALDLGRAFAIAADDELVGRRLLVVDGALHGEAFVPVERVLPARPVDSAPPTVLITGGFGGIGTEYLDLLWNEMRADVVVFGRRSLDDLAAGPESDQERAARIRSYEADGLNLRFVRCDLSDALAVRAAVDGLRSEGTVISGVVHLAGVAEEGMLFRKSPEDVHRVVDAKATGAAVLLAALDRAALRFFVASSSMTTVLGAPGQFSYTFANAYLEGLAATERSVSVTRWPGWRGTGMATAFGVDDAPEDAFFLASLSTEGARGYLRQSITREYGDLIAGRTTTATVPTLSPYLDVSAGVEATAPGKGSEVGPGQPADPEFRIRDFETLVITGVDRELDDLEKFIAVLFASVLDVETVDVAASFTDMGGDSLKAFSIYTPLVERLDVDLEVADIFIHSSVLELSEHVRGMQDA